MSTQRHLDIEFYCPLSGARIGNQVIPPHKMAVMQCENGVLFSRCPNHMARCFIADFTTVKAVMDNSTVIRTTIKNKKKESKDAAS